MSSPLRVLLLGENPESRAMVARALRQEFPVVHVDRPERSSLQDTLAAGSFDVGIADSSDTPKADSIEALRTVKRSCPHLPMILWTAADGNGLPDLTVMNDLVDSGYIIASKGAELAAAVRTALSSEHEQPAEAWLEESAYDDLPIGVYIADQAGNMVYANRALARLLGFPKPTDLAGSHVGELHDGVDAWSHLIPRPAIKGGESQARCRMRAVDGGIRWVHERIVIRDDGRALGMMEDVTQQVELERTLRRSEERFRLLSTSAFEGIGIHDQGRILDANETMAELFGYRLPELIGKNGLELTIPEHREQVLEKIISADETPYEIVGLRRDGSKFPVELVGRTIPYRGKIVRVLAVRDITEQKKALAKLRESEEKYSNLFDQSSDAIVIHDRDGRILDINRKAVALLDLSIDRLAGYRIQDFLDTDETPLAKLQAEGAIDMDIQMRRTDGDIFPAQAYSSRFVFSGQDLYQWSIRDTSERNRLERQLRQAQRMEAVGRLAGGVAHDFNNLLTVITMYCDLVLGRLGEWMGPLREDVLQIKKAGERAASLTRQLLAFSRQQVLRPQVLDLNVVVTDLGKMLRRLIREDIELRTHLVEDLGRIRVDPGQLEQVIMNLVVNSRDAMPQGGTLCIETANIEVRVGEDIEHPIMKPGAYVALMVGDTGIGIDPEGLSRIFEPFFTTKERGEGTGLGLSTVYGIVKQSGGYIFAESQLGAGSKFKVYLPRVDAPPEAGERPGPETGIVKGSGTILVVEDEKELRALVGKVLRENGYTVLEATQGREAIDLVHQYEGGIDLLLTDLVMPGMSGRELAEEIADLAPMAKVIFMSGYSDEAIAQQGKLRGSARFLEKPFTAQTLASSVGDLLSEADG